MKLKAFVASFLFCNIMLAQPTLNVEDFGSDLQCNLIKTTNFYSSPSSYDQYGANTVWDFSTTNFGTYIGTQVSVPISSVPFASSYPDATSAQKQNLSSGNVEYLLYKTTTNSLVLRAHIDESGNSINYGPIIVQKLPLVYQQSYEHSPGITFGVWTFNSEYDGYGTLITPFGTFLDVFRINSKMVAGGWGNLYQWYGTNPYRIILEVRWYKTFGPFSTFYDYTTLQTEDYSIEKVLTYIDSNNNVVVDTGGRNSLKYDIEIFNLLGQNVQQFKNLKGDSNTITTISKGIYVLKIVDDSGNTLATKKVVVGK